MKTLCMVVAVVALGVLSGCRKKGSAIDSDALDLPLREVVERHDEYVEKDTTLQPVEKRIRKRTSALIVKVLDTAQRKDSESKEK